MKIAVYGRMVDSDNVEFIRQLFAEIEKREIEFSVHQDFIADLMNKVTFKKTVSLFEGYNDIVGNTDFLLSVGGDGTLLDTVGLVRDSGIPVMGINMGRLGFLSAASRDDITMALDALVNETYIIDSRSLIHLDSNKPLFDDVNFALNEFSIHKKDPSSMVVVHTYINGEFLNSYWADGLIVSTPTGSTGYSLSCGGPIVFPGSGNFVVTPVAPHNLNVRPIIVPDNTTLSFEVEGRTTQFMCTLDSRSELIDSSFQIAVNREAFNLKLVRMEGRNFLATLRNKLLWGADKRN